MKKMLFLIALLASIFVHEINAQVPGVAISDNGDMPDPSAMLDVQSTSGGVLIPRMTNDQMNGIYDPANGLMVYNTENSSPYYYDGIQWKSLAGSNGIEHFIYYADSIGGVTINNNSYSQWQIPISGITSEDIVTVNSIGDPNNGGNIVIDARTEDNFVIVKLSNVSSQKNYPKLISIKILIHRP